MGKNQSKPNATTIGDDVNKKGKSPQSNTFEASTSNGVIGTAQLPASAIDSDNVATVFTKTAHVSKRGANAREGKEDTNESSSSSSPVGKDETKSTANSSVKASNDDTTAAIATPNTQAVVHQDVGHSGNLCIDDFELLKVLGMIFSVNIYSLLYYICCLFLSKFFNN